MLNNERKEYYWTNCLISVVVPIAVKKIRNNLEEEKRKEEKDEK